MVVGGYLPSTLPSWPLRCKPPSRPRRRQLSNVPLRRSAVTAIVAELNDVEDESSSDEEDGGAGAGAGAGAEAGAGRKRARPAKQPLGQRHTRKEVALKAEGAFSNAFHQGVRPREDEGLAPAPRLPWPTSPR